MVQDQFGHSGHSPAGHAVQAVATPPSCGGEMLLDMGLCIATGVVEAGCRNIVGARLKRSGMHWTVDGANAIIALRCSILSNRFDDFSERRALAA